MSKKQQQTYIDFANLISLMRNSRMKNYKRENLNIISRKYQKRDERQKYPLTDLEIHKIMELLTNVQTAVDIVDVKKECYVAVANFKKKGYVKEAKGATLEEMNRNFEILNKSFQTLFEGTKLDFNKVSKVVEKFYIDNKIPYGGLGSGSNKVSLTAKQLKELDAIYGNFFKNLPAARTALSNIFSIYPKLRKGGTWGTTTNDLVKSFNGSLHSITGLGYELMVKMMMEEQTKKHTFKSLGELEALLQGSITKKGVFQKVDVLINFIPSSNLYAKNIENIRKSIGVSVKSHTLINKDISLHGTGVGRMDSWITRGREQSSPHSSKIIVRAVAEQLVEVGKNGIKLQKKYQNISDRTMIENKLDTVFKNTLYYHADIFLGEDVRIIMGSNMSLTVLEFIELLKEPTSMLYANVGAKNVNIKAHLLGRR